VSFSSAIHRGLLLFLLFHLLALGSGVLAEREIFRVDQKTLMQVEHKYGKLAIQRILAWEKLIQQHHLETDLEKLEKVNAFFNQMGFVDDFLHWGIADYWATPIEFLATGGGDCEDFALAKFFTLIALGVDEDKLNMTYVKALDLNQAHMVVTYFSSVGAEPLVLDNLVDKIEPSSKRSDLLPIYSFNGTGLWLAKTRGQGQLVGRSDRMKRWRELLQRLPAALH
jgi:predicted transglutaminase-like cysteine proteinase